MRPLSVLGGWRRAGDGPGLLGLLLVGALGASCVAEDFVTTLPFACATHAECLASYHCDARSGTCVPGPPPAAPDADAPAGDGGADAAMNLDRGLPADLAGPGDGGETGRDQDPPPDVAVSLDQTVSLDLAVSLDQAVSLDLAPLADVAVSADADPDAQLPPNPCAGQAEFSPCGPDDDEDLRCVRGTCCGVDDVRAACNPRAPGFFYPREAGNQRFGLGATEVYPGGLAENEDRRPLIIDFGTGLFWIGLSTLASTPAEAQEMCRQQVGSLETEQFDGDPTRYAALRLPDAYELWSLLAFADARAARLGPVAAFFEDQDMPLEDPGRQTYLFTRVVTEDGRALTVGLHDRSMAVDTANAERRVLCVAGGRRPGTGTQPQRLDDVHDREGDDIPRWTDPWSGRIWQYRSSFTEPFIPDQSMGSSVPPLATQATDCDDLAANWVVPLSLDALARLDIGAGARALTVRDLMYPDVATGSAPILVGDATDLVQRAVRPNLATVAPFSAPNANASERKLYCLSPPSP